MYVYKEYKPGRPGEVGSLDYKNCRVLRCCLSSQFIPIELPRLDRCHGPEARHPQQRDEDESYFERNEDLPPSILTDQPRDVHGTGINECMGRNDVAI